MPVVRYTATRSLVSGVTLNDTITADLPVVYAGINRTRTVFETTRRALSGSRETYYETGENSWVIRTYPVALANADDVVMFLDSVEDGQQFEFGPLFNVGDGGIVWLNAVLEPKGYEEQRHPQSQNRLTYGFTIVEVP